ncbi:MAG: hypothetical protein CM1200mP41_11990 [Gammaproteobacteria bacterium]|nr:MAG: hypothetical protein CM1200mP41_11990 [Gammaproteobacteria bacterium]
MSRGTTASIWPIGWVYRISFRAATRSTLWVTHYFTYYETASVMSFFGRISSPIRQPIPLTQEIMAGVFINATRSVCERMACVGAARGGI